MKLLERMRQIWNAPVPDVTPNTVEYTAFIPLAIAGAAGLNLAGGDWWNGGLLSVSAIAWASVWRYFAERNARRAALAGFLDDIAEGMKKFAEDHFAVREALKPFATAGRKLLEVVDVADDEQVEIVVEGHRFFITAGDLRRGGEAGRALDAMIAGRVVTCTIDPRDPEDRYGRALGSCFAGTLDLNLAMVREGLAIAYRRYLDYADGTPRRQRAELLAAEAEARAARRGIWQGRFDLPELWRARNRDRNAR